MSRQFIVRLPDDLSQWLEARLQAQQKANPYLRPTMSDVIRGCVWEAMQAERGGAP
jgi:hypothetical protein